VIVDKRNLEKKTKNNLCLYQKSWKQVAECWSGAPCVGRVEQGLTPGFTVNESYLCDYVVS
jgi:hypothetical protein